MKKLILVLIVLAVVGGGVAAYYMKRSTPEPTVSTAQISRGDIVDSVGATGTLEAVETVDIGTQVSGVVEAMYADYNSIVKRGQVVARLDPSLIQTAIEQQRANVTRAEADLERLRVSLTDAQQKLSRARQLSEAKLIPRTELETAEINVKTQDAQIRSSMAGLTQARSQLNTQEVNLSHTIIKAPIDGIVISRNVDQGQTVQASMNAPTLYVLAADLTKMQVIANIDESEIGKMRPGQPVTFRVDAYVNEVFTGNVSQVRLQPTTVQNVVVYATVISVPNPELKLKPGMTATVTIEIARKNDVLRAPNAALRFRPTNDVFAALKQEVPPEMQRGGRGGQAGAQGAQGAQGARGAQGAPGATSGPGAGGTPAAGAPQAPASAGNPPRPQTQAVSQQQRRPEAAAQGGGDRGAERPQGDRQQGDRGGRSNMTPEEREARRKQFEERMAKMTPEERAAMQQRMQQGGGRGGFNRSGDGQGGGRGAAPAGAGSTRTAGNQAARPGQSRGAAADAPSRLSTTSATTIDQLFAPLPVVEGRGRVWMFVNKQLKSIPIRTGITDGTWTEILESADTAPLQPATEVVINVVTGLEPTTRPGQQGNTSPLMGPQRGQQPGRGNPGGGGGRGR